MPILRGRELVCPPNAKHHISFDEIRRSGPAARGGGSGRSTEATNTDHNAEHNHEMLCWTPVPDPWRRARRRAVRLILTGVFALGTWALARQLPTVSFAAFRSPAVVPVQMPIAHTDVEDPPAPLPPIVTQAPTSPRGPVVRTIAE
jgi:hypothetical protein